MKYLILLGLLIFAPSIVIAGTGSMPLVAGIRPEFILFGLTLIGVALFQKRTMIVSLIGLASVLIIKYIYLPDFSLWKHIAGDADNIGEWRILLNIIGLLFGFAILAKHFEESKVPEKLPNYLPDDWRGGFVLLLFIMVLATFLDSIASAMIGGTIAFVVFKGRVHIGYLACIVGASNAGGAGSVLGNLPTTMMWLDGISPLLVTRAFVGSIAAVLICGIFGSIQQDRYQRIQKDATLNSKVDIPRLIIVLMILVGAIITNWTMGFPIVGVWIAIFVGATFRKTPWYEIGIAMQGTIFLTALVTCASLMPVNDLPAASWQSAFSLGFVSAVFDNIPLTKLCLAQGGYDWPMLAYTVGFGGSMIWFGSSAGVAITNMYPEAKSVINYARKGWHVTVAYIVGFFFMYSILGWNPSPSHKATQKSPKINNQESYSGIKESKPPN